MSQWESRPCRERPGGDPGHFLGVAENSPIVPVPIRRARVPRKGGVVQKLVAPGGQSSRMPPANAFRHRAGVAPIAPAIGVPKAQEADLDQRCRAGAAQQSLLSLRDTESRAFGATLRCHPVGRVLYFFCFKSFHQMASPGAAGLAVCVCGPTAKSRSPSPSKSASSRVA